MFDLITEVYKSLASWPGLQFAFAIIGGYFGIKLIMRGEREKKPVPVPVNGETTPRWFVTEQNLEILRDILSENRQQTQLLEQIANENVINPRRLQE